MRFLIVVTIVAVLVAAGALQNGQTVTVSFFFWQFEAPLALIILAATVAGLTMGVLVGWARALRRWRQRRAEPAPGPDGGGRDRPTGSTTLLRARIRR
jgi:uncharacterized integral membrane protein